MRLMVTAVIGSIAFAFAITLYILIALGLPYGEFDMGGNYTIVPKGKRFIFGVSVLIQLVAIIVVLQTAGLISLLFSQSITRIICFFFAGYLTLNIFANAISKSKKEKYVMTPLSAIIATCFWITAIGIKNCTFYRFYIPCPLNPRECSKIHKTTHSRMIFKNHKIRQ